MEIKDCFVIMPFSTSQSHTEEEWTEIFEDFFKSAWNAFSIDCYRTKVPRGSITKDIFEKLYSASIVFADLTDSNPNVLYELGVRHTFKKPSVMVRAKGSEIPFDVNDYNVFEYKYTPKGLKDLKKHIKIVIEDIKKFPNKSDNPVWDFRNTSDFLADYYRNTEAIQKLKAIKEELESNLLRCDVFLAQISHIKIPQDYQDWARKPDEYEQRELETRIAEFYPNMRNDAITHLKIARYIDFTEADWYFLNEVDDFLRWCHCYSSNLAAVAFYIPERDRISEKRDVIRQGIDVIRRRISELESR